jgi:hypothetical protein
MAFALVPNIKISLAELEDELNRTEKKLEKNVFPTM